MFSPVGGSVHSRGAGLGRRGGRAIEDLGDTDGLAPIPYSSSSAIACAWSTSERRVETSVSRGEKVSREVVLRRASVKLALFRPFMDLLRWLGC